MTSLASGSALAPDQLEALIRGRRRLGDHLVWLFGGPGRSVAVGRGDMTSGAVGLVIALLTTAGAWWSVTLTDAELTWGAATFGLIRVLALLWPMRMSGHRYAIEITLDSALLVFWLLTAGPAAAILYWLLASVAGEALRTHVLAVGATNVGLSAVAVLAAGLAFECVTALPLATTVPLLACVLAAVAYVIADHVATFLLIMALGQSAGWASLAPPTLWIGLGVSAALTCPGWAMTTLGASPTTAGLVLVASMTIMIVLMSVVTQMSEDRARLRLIVAFLHRTQSCADDEFTLRELELVGRELAGTEEVAVRRRPPAASRREIGFALQGSRRVDTPRIREELEPQRWLVARVRDLDSCFHPQEVSALETLALVAGEALALRRAAVATQWLATHDVLTTLPNRTQLLDHMLVAERAAGQSGSWGEAAAILVDIDGFKDINDRISHEAGDHVLATLGPRIRETLDGDGVAARLGGDEFAVFLPSAPSGEGVRAHCDRIRDRIREPVDWQGRSLHLDASVGYSLGPVFLSTSLLREADAAMYLIKHSGKGGVAQYVPRHLSSPRE